MDRNFNFTNIPQPIAFLNGTEGWCGPEEEISESAISQGLTTLLLDDLFNHPEKLMELKTGGAKTIAVQTTGQNFPAIEKVIDAFHQLNFIPEAVILIFEDPLWCEARDFKKAHPETQIFTASLFDHSFEPLEFS